MSSIVSIMERILILSEELAAWHSLRISMSATENPTATSIVDVDTNNRTVIGCELGVWKEHAAEEYWKADFIPTNKREYYRHLNEINDGKKNGVWQNKRYFTDDDNRHLIEAVTQHLELTTKQKVRAKRYFLSQDLDQWGIRKEIVAWQLVHILSIVMKMMCGSAIPKPHLSLLMNRFPE